MGLDQYAYAVLPNEGNTDFSYVGETVERVGENDTITTRTDVQISYWRKHPNLEGWMRDLFYRKAEAQGYDSGHDYNCQPLRLTWDDLNDLERAVLGDELPETNGFFFGESRPEHKEDDLAFIKEARKAIRGDYEVYYYSWW